jgi:hypothetical protein
MNYRSLSLYLLLIPAALLSGCCTKKGCIGADNLDIIYFAGFENREELTSIVIKEFEKESGFTLLLDSTAVTISDFNDLTEFQGILLPRKMSKDFDYRIELPEAGLAYDISDIASKRKTCDNGGFLCNDHYNALESYRVNGLETRDEWRIIIHK